MVFIGGSYYWAQSSDSIEETAQNQGVNRQVLASALGDIGVFQRFPTDMTIPVHGKDQKVVVQYAFDAKLQESMENLIQSYHPDYGAFVAIDATTGRVLSMVSFSQDKDLKENLALRATFPSASVFKVVTAAAAIAEQNYSGNTVIAFNGRNHTLYRSAILKHSNTRWTRHMTLKEAFGKSVNTVFGRIGAYTVGAETLRNYADRFGFNRKIVADFPIQEGKAEIINDPWSLAETASGYTRDNTMSPLQGALIAASIVNDGMMMDPFVVQSVHAQDGSQLYSAKPHGSEPALDPETARKLRVLMRETVTRGTSKKWFRGFFKGDMSRVDVGGKTGSLTGMDPPGKYDWFVGYADHGTHRIAVAALTINAKVWRVKSSYLARRAFEAYFRDRLRSTRIASVESLK